ncbi:MAG: purine/pyrimidine permease [Deltaproteobacteria bacterium]|nr:purine/pyrimidine permease [Deltaproteobacteria bacterium]
MDQKPPWPRAMAYGFQWMIIFLPTLMILSAISSEYLKLPEGERILFFQRVLVTTGGIMILQTLWGHRYPLLDGPSSALLLTLLVLAPGGMPAIQGGMIIGGILLVLLAALRLMRYVEALFTDNVVGVTLILIAITLLPYLAPLLIGQHPGSPRGDLRILGVSLVTVAAIALFSQRLAGFFRTLSLLWGILLGTFLMGLLGRLDFSVRPEVQWFSLPPSLVSEPPRFVLSAILPFLVAYLAVVINGVGSMYSIGEIVGKENMGRRVARGIGLTGAGSILAGALGSIGTVSFGISPGVVLITRVGSRFPLTLCGVFLCLLAFFQKFLMLLLSIPPSVVGAALLTAMASQVGAGISVLTRTGRSLEGRDYLVIGLPILLAGIITLLPEDFFRTLSFSAQAFLKNGLVVGIVAVLLLEHLVLREKK